MAVGSAVLGLVALLPYCIAGAQAGETTTAFNAAIHAAGSVGVLVLLRVPRLEHWVNAHVMGSPVRLEH